MGSTVQCQKQSGSFVSRILDSQFLLALFVLFSLYFFTLEIESLQKIHFPSFIGGTFIVI